ncbi:MAG: MFS transporter [candidate division NC10 bacterium]
MAAVGEGRTMTLGALSGFRRDARIIGLVGSAHFTSHFFQLALPPIFPLLRAEFRTSYVALGLLMTVFYGASGIMQTVSGFLVDRFGAHRVLVSGIALLAGAIGLAGLAASYGMLAAVALLAGMGNSVFHPADYAIFNSMVSPGRLGRAYGVHSICGNLGWAAAPAFIVTLSALFGWRAALVTAGGLGLMVALALSTQGEALRREQRQTGHCSGMAGAGLRESVGFLLQTPILMAFAYFALMATALIGLQTFSVTAMVAIYEAPLTLATGSLTGFLLGSAAGILVGGFLADRNPRHDVVAGTGMLLGACLSLVLGTGAPALPLLAVMMTLTGFCLGVTSPSRDMLVRAATPPGASGKVYGFVYSGLDLGSSITPLVFGWLLDRGEPRLVFVMAAGFMLLTIVAVVQVRRHGRSAALAR